MVEFKCVSQTIPTIAALLSSKAWSSTSSQYHVPGLSRSRKGCIAFDEKSPKAT